MKRNIRKVVVVMPAYNAGTTLKKTYEEIPKDYVDDVIVVDDASSDTTAVMAEDLGVELHVHEKNRGYGANQKTCYDHALKKEADIVIMLHPDYQYTPKLIPAMVTILESGLYDVVLGSRILSKGALIGGMPIYKYVANRLLTLIQNILIGQKLSEYHTGYRAYTRDVLETIDYHRFSEDFIFDNQMLIAIFDKGYRVSEITCPTKYFEEASSINFKRSSQYGLLVIWNSVRYLFKRLTG